MIKKIWKMIAGFEQTVETIVADFSEVVPALERHAEDKWERVAHHMQQKNEGMAAAAQAEAMKAEKVGRKFKELIG